jgi:hypothetical protein
MAVYYIWNPIDGEIWEIVTEMGKWGFGLLKLKEVPPISTYR